MDAWPEEFRADIVKRLQERGMNRPCGRCGHEKFTLVDGYAVFALAMKLEAEHAERLLPSVCIACARCGYLTFHALAALGMLSENQPLPPGDGAAGEPPQL